MNQPSPAPTPAKKRTPVRGPFAALATVAIAAAIIAPWEGLRTEPYFDIVGVATVCFGQTGPAAAPGRRYTEAQCRDMLGEEVAAFGARLDRCIAPDARMSPQQQAVVLSWAYNVGTTAACGSTLVRQLNAGQPPDVWCDQLLRWDRAGGKQVRGLTRRRQHEHQLCEAG